MTPAGHEPHRPTHASTLPTTGKLYTPNTCTESTQIPLKIAAVVTAQSPPNYSTLYPITRYPTRPASPINTASLRTGIRLRLRLYPGAPYLGPLEHARLPAV
jgi:hypothetical protein